MDVSITLVSLVSKQRASNVTTTFISFELSIVHFYTSGGALAGYYLIGNERRIEE